MARPLKVGSRVRAKSLTAKKWRAAGVDWHRIARLCLHTRRDPDHFSDSELGKAGAEMAIALYRLTRAGGNPGGAMRQMVAVAQMVLNAERQAGADPGMARRQRYLLTLRELSGMLSELLPQERGRRGFRTGIIARAMFPNPDEVSTLAATLQAQSPALSNKAAVLKALSNLAPHVEPAEQILMLSYYEKRYSDARGSR